MHCAKDIISAIFIMAVSPFALKNLASKVLASRQSLYNANWRKYNSFHYLKSAKYLSFAVSGLGTIKGLEGQLKDFGAGSF